MENDKKELLYVMNLLRNKPKKEISKDITAFKINKKFQFNVKPESKFEAVINDNFFKNINSLLPQSNNNDNVFITLQAKENNNELNIESLSTKNTLTKQFSAKDIVNSSKNKSSTYFQKTKPNLNITKFSNATRTASLLREQKWFYNNKNNNNYGTYFFNRAKNNNKNFQKNKKDNLFINRLISKIKIRYLNFRPYIDLPTILPKIYENNKNLEQENNANINNSDSVSISTYNNMNNVSQISHFSQNNNSTQYYFKLIGNESLLVKKLLEDNGFIQSKGSENWTIAWSSGHIKLNSYENLSKYQRINHFPRSNELTRKDLLYKNLSKLKELFPGTKFDFLPESYILPNEFTFLKDRMDNKTSGVIPRKRNIFN